MGTVQQGFTLVEIAIVLVIIGLLLGGILKGQEMITQAKIKNLINDFNGISAAMYSYQDRYRALPGDEINASARWKADGGAAITHDGNGNGVFDCSATNKGYNVPIGIPTDAGTKECNMFWQ
ncbi:MAG: prepilin-type N-terminal cleavage/methylation domain-containing protein, partial [Betaproteobacteria bacterium]|nr:prepilin-type N-terminal cleavage/methylation domain-containing protein [Betaproteobacteria bacterium]